MLIFSAAYKQVVEKRDQFQMDSYLVLMRIVLPRINLTALYTSGLASQIIESLRELLPQQSSATFVNCAISIM